MEDRFGHRISYLRVSITDRCNERCTYCMPRELQEWLPREDVLTYEETLRLIRVATELGVSKVRITGGEPLTRRDVLSFFEMLRSVAGIDDLGLSTNGTLLARRTASGVTMAQALCAARVHSVNISLDTLDPEVYAQTTGRDFLPQALAGIDAAIAAGFEQIKLNCVLMRGRNEEQFVPLVEYAAARNLILRFIELMPVSTSDVLHDDNFLPVAEARRTLESRYGPLIPEPAFRTNGPSSYYKVPGRDQRIGFIGAMSNLHFCESCNKLRLTCDGKLRPCLGSYLEFDIMKVMRAGATDAELKRFFLDVVERKPEQHDFRENYQPGRMMVAIGG
jgi:GTP 3',8-cyclase